MARTPAPSTSPASPYEQIFTVDGRGQSVAFDPAELMQPSPLLNLHDHPDRDPAPAVAASLFDLGSVRGPGDAVPRPLLDAMFGSPTTARPQAPPADAPADQIDQTSVRIALWVVLGVIALFAVVFFEVSVFLAVIIVGVVGRFLNRPPVLTVLAGATRRFGQYEYRPPER